MTRPDPSVRMASVGPRRGVCPNGHQALVFDVHALSDSGVASAPEAAVFCTHCPKENR